MLAFDFIAALAEAKICNTELVYCVLEILGIHDEKLF